MKLSSPFGCLSGPLQQNNWSWFGGAYREGGKNKSDGRRREKDEKESVTNRARKNFPVP